MSTQNFIDSNVKGKKKQANMDLFSGMKNLWRGK